MRLLVEFKPSDEVSYNEINNYFVQSLIWSRLKDTDFQEMHDFKGFKFFNFSNIFPVEDFNPEKKYKIIISSPNEYFIQTLKQSFEREPLLRLGKHIFNLVDIKSFKLPLKEKWLLGSPLVLYKNNLPEQKGNEYFSFQRHKDFEFFFNRIKENALKKYRIYFNDNNFDFKFLMFDSFKFKRTVVHKLRKDKKEFVIIGTLGEFKLPKLHSARIKRFFHFIQDVGLGEKNSLGYGFINPFDANEK